MLVETKTVPYVQAFKCVNGEEFVAWVIRSTPSEYILKSPKYVNVTHRSACIFRFKNFFQSSDDNAEVILPKPIISAPLRREILASFTSKFPLNVIPSDIVSGKMVQNKNGTFWFKEPGHNIKDDGWPIEGRLHSENDLPAAIYASGTQYWYKNGEKHRDNDLPAAIYASGTQYWYKNGEMHRDNDLPAVIGTNGVLQWWENGKCHRDNDLPAIIYENGDQHWYKNGKLHRDNDLPAIVHADGSQEWYKNDELHRDNNLPAIIHADGSQEWWVNGERI